MRDIGYYNGKCGPIEEMTIPMNDRAVYFGDGVYDAAYAAGRKIYALDDHLDRFYASCKKLEIPFSMPRKELADLLQSLVDRVDDSASVMAYWQASRGTGMRSHAFPGPDVTANLLITVRPAPMRAISRPLKLISLPDTRFLHCDVKTLNLIPSVVASQRAKENGCDEAVFHRDGRVTECAHSNIHIIRDGIFQTAPLNNLILPGTARKHLLHIAESCGIPFREDAFSLEELRNADEILVSSAGTLGNAVSELDGEKVGGRAPDLLTRIQKAAVAHFEKDTGVSFARYSL